MQNIEKHETELVDVQRKLEGLHLSVSSLPLAENGAQKFSDDGLKHEKQHFSAQQPSSLLPEFLSFIFETLHRPDLLNHADILNLRLVNKHTKSCIEKMAPFTRFRLDVGNLPALFRLFYMPERLETLEVTLSKATIQSLDTHSCIYSLFRPLPRLASLRISNVFSYSAQLCLRASSCWPALTSLELGDDLSPGMTLCTLFRTPLVALKQLCYSSPTPVAPESLSKALSSLNELTYLGLTTIITHNNCDVFRNNALPKLKVARLTIRTKGEDASSPAHGVTAPALVSWPKLRKLSITSPESYLINNLHGAPFLKELQSMGMVFDPTSRPLPNAWRRS
jgi:hypothetical protein